MMMQRSAGSYACVAGGLGGLLGGLLPVAYIILMVFVLDIRIDLSTGFDWINSMLYSTGGPIGVVLVAIYWSILGALLGAITGGVTGGLYGITRQQTI